MISGIAIIGQRCRWCWWRGRCRWRCRWAALALSPAAESLLALRPALLPIREARSAIIRARSGCRRRRRRRGHRGATNVMVCAAPHLLAHVPGQGGTESTVGLRWRSGWRWSRRWSRLRCRGTADTIMLATPVLLVQAPQTLALAAIWFGGRCGNVLRRGAGVG